VTLPYMALELPRGISPYGLSIYAAVGAGMLTAWRFARRAELPDRDFVGMAAVLAGAGFLGAHVFDVAWYRLDAASADPGLWFRVMDGISLFGFLLVVTVGLLVRARVRGVPVAGSADVIALGCLTAITIGRVGCALVHDHPGVPTSSVLGVDFPMWVWPQLGDLETVRRHDLGLEELLAMIPLTALAWGLAHRRPRAGLIAALAALAYAAVRFSLDFLRVRELEPVRGGLTGGQWGSIALFAAGSIGLVLVLRRRP